MTSPRGQEPIGLSSSFPGTVQGDAFTKKAGESEASRLFHASQSPFEQYNYITTDLNARIEKEKREHQASSFRKNIVLVALTVLCLASGSASILLLLTSDDDRTRDKAFTFGTASISFLAGLLGGSQL
ncbi:MAG: hypothetical protein FJ083_12505 [Cyanobacteria bacterium K_Offshore_surface_m2_239]|nr:hypothetical protein [Cyanobacteria bacterium K_Offshore_surface_m2_239]